MKKLIIILITIAIIFMLVFSGVVLYVRSFADGNVYTAEDVPEDADCILVLGAGVMNDGSPSLMLADRLDKGIELYNLEKAPKLLMSGDHGREEYDEVNTMKDYAVSAGVPSEDCFMDHAGFSTYDSLYRAKEIFGADSLIVVTQSYHLYRALFIAEQLGIKAYGVSSDTIRYPGQAYRNFREILAYGKAFLWCLFDVEPEYLGESIPVSGNGDITNDK